MPSKNSLLVDFLQNALMVSKYPNLFWVDETEAIFCLQCICKYQKKWSEDENRIFEDYYKLKPRKSESKRQVLLSALEASPYIKILKDLSIKEKKFYNFSRKTKNLPDSGMSPCQNEIAEISVKSPFPTSMDVHNNTSNVESVNSAQNENDGMKESLKDFSEMLDYDADSIVNIGNEVSNTALCGDEVSNTALCGDEVSNTALCGDEVSNTALCGDEASNTDLCGDEATTVPCGVGDEASTVLDGTMDISDYYNDNISQSVFVKSFNANGPCNSNLFPDVSDLHEMEHHEYLDDYDPILDLYQSIENINTSSQEIPTLDSKPSQWEVKESQEYLNASTSDCFIPTATASQSTCSNVAEQNFSSDSSITECMENENNATNESDTKATPKTTGTLKDTLMPFRKYAEKPTVPFIAAKSAVCIEAEQSMKYMEMEEWRREQQAKAESEKHELCMELLKGEIKLLKAKTDVQEKLLAILEANPQIYFPNYDINAE